jgi:hypothetical protein
MKISINGIKESSDCTRCCIDGKGKKVGQEWRLRDI